MSRRESGARDGVLVVACGALARELEGLTRDLPGVSVEYLPATLHSRPEHITDAVLGRVRAARARGWTRVLVGYMDCGTGGLLDAALAGEGVERLPGAHCYELYAGRAPFAALHDAEPGTFYLTDFLVRSFEGLVWRGLGLDQHPSLRDAYFGNYRRIVHLAQVDDAALEARGRAAATRLGLAYERRLVGLGELGLSAAAGAAAAAAAPRALTGSPQIAGFTPVATGIVDPQSASDVVADRRSANLRPSRRGGARIGRNMDSRSAARQKRAPDPVPATAA